jgi:ABC-type lipoprotein export system ATPase subunit
VTAPVAIRNLNHSYGSGGLKKQILFDVTADIQEGEIVIVTGPSGGGKTTLLTLVGALRAAQDGSLAVLGQELRGARKSAATATRTIAPPCCATGSPASCSRSAPIPCAASRARPTDAQ